MGEKSQSEEKLTTAGKVTITLGKVLVSLAFAPILFLAGMTIFGWFMIGALYSLAQKSYTVFDLILVTLLMVPFYFCVAGSLILVISIPLSLKTTGKLIVGFLYLYLFAAGVFLLFTIPGAIISNKMNLESNIIFGILMSLFYLALPCWWIIKR